MLQNNAKTDRTSKAEGIQTEERRFEREGYGGIGIGTGSAVGQLYFLPREGERADFAAQEGTTQEGTTQEDVAQELARFRRALADARAQNEQSRNRSAEMLGEEETAIFEIYDMLLTDEELILRIEDGITQGMGAAGAVREATAYYAKRFSEMEDAYLRARAADLSGLGELIVSALREQSAEKTVLPIGAILVAPDLTPNQTVALDRKRIAGFVTFGGAPTSHTAILARAMGLPALICTGELPRVWDGKQALLDARAGKLYPEPDAALLEEHSRRVGYERAERELLDGLRGQPTVSRGGRKIHLYANIGSVEEAQIALQNDAEGIGLFRSEFLYLGREAPPSEEEEFCAYREVVRTMHFRRVIIRTLDIGADKQPDYMRIGNEENPALGVRGIRASLARPLLFRRQLRAILRAAAYGRAAIMFPMVTLESELLEAREQLRIAMEELERGGVPYDRTPEVGIMLETPAAALLADRLAPLCDFFSVGSNDLFQYLYAADRQNALLSSITDAYPEALFRLIAAAAQSLHRTHGKWIGVCGELAANPRYTQRLLDCGVDEVSVSAPLVLGVRREIRNCR